MNKKFLIYGGIAVVSAGVGFGAGYLVTKKKLEGQLESEIESVREAYRKNAIPKPDLLATKREVLTEEEAEAYNTGSNVHTALLDHERQYQDKVISAQGYNVGSDETDADAFKRVHGRIPTVQELIEIGDTGRLTDWANRVPADHDDSGVLEGNLFENPPEVDPEDVEVGEDEIPPRSPDRPYVIKAEEWFLNETNYDQITLTYWADDDVLADDVHNPVPDPDRIVGLTNLHRFGFLSDDPEIVYVRNEQMKADYEITKDERNFSLVIHGIDPDAINNTGVPRRMRSNEE